MITQSAGSKVFRYIVLIIGLVVVAFPFLNMIATALTSEQELYASPGRIIWIPRPVQMQNFGRVYTFPNMNFARAFLNTIGLIAFIIITTVVSSSWVAYGFAMIRFPGRSFLFVLMLSTMMIPAHVKLIPQFLIFSRLGWVDTYLPLVVWGVFGNPFFIFLVRQVAMGIPTDMIDASRIDGCNHGGIYWRIYLPQLKAILTAVAVFIFVGEWKHLMGPIIYLRSERLYTIAMELNRFTIFVQGPTGAQLPLLNLVMAASVLTMIPPILTFVIGQKHFLRSLDITSGIKG